MFLFLEFAVDMSSSIHINNQNKYILILDEWQTQALGSDDYITIQS